MDASSHCQVGKEGGRQEREKEWNIFFEGGICILMTAYTDFALYLILSSSFNVGPNCGPLSAGGKQGSEWST